MAGLCSVLIMSVTISGSGPNRSFCAQPPCSIGFASACALMDCVACRAISLGDYIGGFAAKRLRYAMRAMPSPEPTTLGRERNRTQTRSCFCTLTVMRLRPPSLNPASPAAIENWPLEAAAATAHRSEHCGKMRSRVEVLCSLAAIFRAFETMVA